MRTLVLAALAMGSVAAQAAPLDATTRAAALESITTTIRKDYVEPARVDAIVERLGASQRAGRYDTSDPIAFADRVTDDLRAASEDGHLYLRADPDGYAAALAPKPVTDDASWWNRRAVRGHHGLREMRILPGNVRYLRIGSFDWVPDATGQAYDGAMRFLRDGDAIVIDLRGNPGGDASAVRYLVSHFLDEDVLLLTFLEAGKDPVQSRTLGYLPAGRIRGKPLYVLIDGRVGSAAEEFAAHVDQFALGTLVGARTAGAGNNNKLVPIAPGFVLSVSIGRPELAVRHGNWEGKGIAPTLAVDPVRALDVAHADALARIASTPGASPDAVADAQWAMVAVRARLDRPRVDPSTLRAFAGRYGRTTLIFRDDRLSIDRGPRGSASLVPLDANGLFGIEGDDDLRVRATGKTLEMQRRGDASPLVVPRDPG